MPDHMRGKAQGIERLYLDFDSFFATAEQYLNPDLRGKPVGVVPLDSPNTGCIAVSREAKARGVKSSATIRAARQIAPDMIFVVARHDVYVRLHNRILEVIETCLPVANVRSIDELVCHLLPSEAKQGEALANRIKQALADNFSPVLTCSIGMAPTELLAKIGAEMNKPNGFAEIHADALPHALNALSLSKLPGVSDGMEKRLIAAGVHCFEDLWRLAPKQARAIWGNVEGERFWNGLHGFHVERPKTKKRMFGHSRMLPTDWRTPDKVEACARQLTMSAARRLRRADLFATKVTLSCRGGGYRSATGSRKDDQRWEWHAQLLPARDDRTFLRTLRSGLQVARKEMGFRPRSISVMLHGLEEEALMTGDLFDVSPARHTETGPARKASADWERISAVMDKLRIAHGPDSISLGPRCDVPGGYLGAKIAFGRIPDAADFNSAAVPDEQTHFCSF
ncbi:ImpB/MucB/SamB family [Sulfitobacter noctilucae]|uniref:Y-family DNA polymerase n=1 Tax=Sulfitobacter noctilucae TaxID=1342302 RepID=UPI000AC8BEA5|nr:type VI secretion protein ImpB [Sulfitobacter noctilucae]KIN65852.1 ImpB/MucB/SamB family [Sulfitobacter noctilucae]